MTYSRYLLNGLLILQLALSPTTLWATSKLEPANINTLREAIFNHIVAQSMMIESAGDFDLAFFRHLNSNDRKDALAVIAKATSFPSFKRQDQKLVLTDGVWRIEAKWPNLSKKEFEINGVKWTYNPSKSLAEQVDALEIKLNKKKTAGWLFDEILPKAEADGGFFSGPVIMMIVGALIGTTGGLLFRHPLLAAWCLFFPTLSEECINLKRSQDELLYKDSPTADGVSKQAGADDKNIFASWEMQNESKCPSNNDGKDREYKAQLRTVKIEDGHKIPTSFWFNVLFKYTPTGIPTDMIITTQSADPATVVPKAKDLENKLEVHITFDPTTQKPIGYRIPNPKHNFSKLFGNTPTITLSQAMKLEPDQKKMISEFKDSVAFVNYLATKCVIEQVRAAQQVGIDAGSPATRKKEPSPPPHTTQ